MTTPLEPTRQFFNLGLSIIMKDHIKITFGDGSYLQVRPDQIYSLKKEEYDILVIRGDAMLQTSAPGSWCGIKDLQIQLVPYGPPEEESTPSEGQPLSSGAEKFSILAKFKEIFSNEPKFTLLPSNRGYIIPEWWSKMPILFARPGYVGTDSSRHRRMLESGYWPIEKFDRIKTLKLDRKITIVTD